MNWFYILGAVVVLILVYYGLWALCLSASIADDANENAAIRKAEDEANAETERKLKLALRPLREMDAGMGKREWDTRLEDK